MNGSVVGIYLYYDASIEYFGKKHLPYAILAVFVVLIFIIFPMLLLLLYPMRCCQRCLGHCRVRWHALHTFIDAFQGCFKDGTNGTQDCRYFPALYFVFRLLLFLLYALTLSAAFYAVAILVVIGIAMLIIIVQPYKAKFSSYNVVESVLVLTLAMWCGTAVFVNTAASKAHGLLKASLIVAFLVAVLPLLYLVVILLHWICSRWGVGKRLVHSIKSQIRRVYKPTHDTRLNESLPDRLINPCRYNKDGNHAACYGATGTEGFSNQVYSRISDDQDLS